MIPMKTASIERRTIFDRQARIGSASVPSANKKTSPSRSKKLFFRVSFPFSKNHRIVDAGWTPMSLKGNNNGIVGKRRMRKIKSDLLRWACEQRATNSTLDRRLVREKALELSEANELESFKCSDAWLTIFLKEYGFSLDPRNPAGPIFSNYCEWIDLMRSIVTRYKHEDLFHADELTMYADVSPTRITPHHKYSDDDGGDSAKSRITVLMCCNSSGTMKLPLLICGIYPPMNTGTEHVYLQTEDSRIPESLFRTWLTRLDKRMSDCDRKILLLLQRNRACDIKDLVLSNVSLLFFPKDFPPHLRPIRRDVFHYVKMIYRRSYAKEMLRYKHNWSIRDVLETLINSWEQVPRELMITSFQRTRFRTDDCYLQIGCDCWHKLKTAISFKRFVTFDDHLSDGRPESQRCEKNHRHRYNLRANARDLIKIDDSLDLILGDDVESNQTVLRKNLEDCRDIVATRDVGSNTDRRSTDSWSPNRDKTRAPKRSVDPNSLEDDELERINEKSKSRKRQHSGSSFSSRYGRTKDDGEDIRVRGTLRHPRFEDPGKRHFRSIGAESKEKLLQREAVSRRNDTESVQTIVNKALTLTSKTTADYARKLINSIYESNEESRRNADRFNGENSTSFERDQKAATTFSVGISGYRDSNGGGEGDEPASAGLSSQNCSNREEDNRLSVSLEHDRGSLANYVPPRRQSEERIEGGPRNMRISTAQEGNEDTARSSSNEDIDRPRVSSVIHRKRRRISANLNGSGDDSRDEDQLAEKRLRTDRDWATKYETTFVFGSQNSPGCSEKMQREGNIVVDHGAYNRSQETQLKTDEASEATNGRVKEPGQNRDDC